MMRKKVTLYIRAEDMPGSCAECFLGKRYGCVGDVECKALNEYFTNNVRPPYKERPDECPLIALQERHGQWVNYAGYHHCSVCAAPAPYNGAGEEVLSDHCPNCGAKMDKEAPCVQEKENVPGAEDSPG